MKAGLLAGGSAAAPSMPIDIGWHSLFWTEGAEFIAQGYTDTEHVETWENEIVAESGIGNPSGSRPFDDSHASFNNRPVVGFAAAPRMQSGAWTVGAPTTEFCYVVVGRTSTTGIQTFISGTSTGTQAKMYRDDASPNKWAIYAGSAAVTGGNADTNAHLFIGHFHGSGGTDRIIIDGTVAGSGAAGTAVPSGGISVGAEFNSNQALTGQIALIGIYSGDITTDPLYDDFKDWVETHYGITVA